MMVRVQARFFFCVVFYISPLILHAAVDELLLAIPTHCPLLKDPIAWTRRDRAGKLYHPNMPSIDRIKNELGVRLFVFCVAVALLRIFCSGYVRGNVWIVCHRANVIKNSANWQELDVVSRNLRARADENLQARLSQ
jgi:hypothetical protein